MEGRKGSIETTAAPGGDRRQIEETASLGDHVATRPGPTNRGQVVVTVNEREPLRRIEARMPERLNCTRQEIGVPRVEQIAGHGEVPDALGHQSVELGFETEKIAATLQVEIREMADSKW